jgi:hypothetical protein
MLNRDQLKALLTIAPKKALRDYMCGVYFDSSVPGHTVAVATDGSALLAIRCDSNTGLNGLLSWADADLMVKACRANDDLEIIDGTLSVNGLVRTLKPVKYCDWRLVVPQSANGDAQQFDPEYIARFGKIAKLLGTSAKGLIHIHHNGDKAAVVDFGALAAFGLLMPVNSQKDFPALPRLGWVSPQVEEDLAEAA